MNRRPIAAAALALVLAAPALATARPGGGQSFGGSSRGSSGSGSGSSWGSGSGSGSSWGSSRSSSSDSKPSGGSSWSWGGSSRSTDPTPSSPYTPSYSDAQQRQLEESLEQANCMQECMSELYKPNADMSGCETRCRERKRKERADAQRSAEAARQSTPRLAESPDPPMSLVLGIPVVAVGGILGIVSLLGWMKRRNSRAWASELTEDDFDPMLDVHAKPNVSSLVYPTIRAAMDAIGAKDEDFSWILFEDFAHVLYVEAHRARGERTLPGLAPYLSEKAIAHLSGRGAGPVTTIVVGAMRIVEVRVDETSRTLSAVVSFTSNYTEGAGDLARSYYVEETWVFERNADLRSRPPERVRVVDCPSCGASLTKTVAGKCAHCGTTTAAGSHDWGVVGIRLDANESRGPMLVGTTQEAGTDAPTLVAPDVKERFSALIARDPAVTWLGFTQRVEKIFSTFHVAWSAQELKSVRPFLSDNLFETQRYWIEAYKSERLRNVTEQPKIAAVHLSRVHTDRHFDAITVRVYASCVDYTTNHKGVVVGGDQRVPRQYSEYWTLIRGVDRTGAPRLDDGCPSCGAPTEQINMAGTCTHCNAKITSGAFDWVLSRIEQDEVYTL